MAPNKKKQTSNAKAAPAVVMPRLMPIDALRPNPWNLRTHSKKQIGQVEASIASFGFAGVIVADEDNMVLAGHARLQAARRAGVEQVPVVTLSGLLPARKRAYMLAD